MKITFVCGTIEPGKDGVGDYTRRLSVEMTKKGMQVLIVAINDKYVDEFKVVEFESVGVSEIKIVRFSLNNSQRWNEIKLILEEFSPNIISIQFVIYAYNAKGIPFFLASKFKKLFQNYKVHIMFHELWIGMEKEASLKAKFVGYLQQKIISRMLNLNKPDFITSHTPLYLAQIKKEGYDNYLLPLFGNIPFLNLPNIIKDKSKIVGVVFGGIHYGACIDKLAQDLSIYEKLSSKKIEIVFIGKTGPEQEIWEKSLKNNKINFSSMGLCDEKIVSETLSRGDFGITSTPYLLLGKSGTVAAMREHGLPVICIGRKWEIDPKIMLNSNDLCIFEYKGEIESFFKYYKNGFANPNDIFNQFQELINKYV